MATIRKQPFKFIEIPLNKFQEVIPHHENVFEGYKKTMDKLVHLNDFGQLNREIKDKRKITSQLKNLMYELDTLRTQVEDTDLGKFDSKTLSLRKRILKLLSDYKALETEVVILRSNQNSDNGSFNENTMRDVSQIQMQESSLSELKLQDQQQIMQNVENINKDIEHVHEIFVDLNGIVNKQAEDVNVIEDNIECTNQNTQGGLRHLLKASKLKTVKYPIAGAFLGTMIGGPVGSIAGLKIGGLVSLGCGLVGYFSGKFLNRANESTVSCTEMANSDLNNLHNDGSNNLVKKDI